MPGTRLEGHADKIKSWDTKDTKDTKEKYNKNNGLE